MTSQDKPKDMFLAPLPGSILFQAFCHTFFRSYCHLTVEGRDHLPTRPFMLCSNHASHIDSAALMTATGLSFRNFALVGASDYFFECWRGRLVSPFLNVIPLDREAKPKALLHSFALCRDFVERTSGNLILYPEGTRSITGGMQDFKKGVGLLAVKLGVPVVPAYIEGAGGVLSKGKFVPRPGCVRVRFGRPLTFCGDQLSLLPQRERRRVAVHMLETRIRYLGQMSPETANSR